MIKVIDKIKRRRKVLGFTQSDVAKRIKISRCSYTQIELGGRDITLEEAIKLAKLYKCTLDELVNQKATNGNKPQKLPNV